jgi:hypothetical protein
MTSDEKAVGALTGGGPKEFDLLLTALEEQRRHILSNLDGLDDSSLYRPVLPSGWTCLGLISHLTNDVERFWFRCVVAGEVEAIEKTRSVANAWQVADGTPAAQVIDEYRDEIAKANEILRQSSPDAALAWWPEELFGSWRLQTVRQVVLHVIVETATHAGQLDAVRELIDGKQRLVLT